MNDQEKTQRVKVLDDLERITQILPAPIYWEDVNSVILGGNAAVFRGTGALVREAYVGKTLYELYPYEMAEHIKKHNEEVMRTGKILSQEEVIEDITTGELKYFTAVKAPLRDDEGNIIGIVGTSVDISAEKEAARLKLENELQKAQLVMQEELAHVSRLNSMGTIAASIAHELNNPLSAIINSCGAAQRFLGKLPENVVPQSVFTILINIKTQAERSSNIIYELRNFLRKDTDSKREYLNVNHLIKNVLTFVKDKLLDGKISVTLKLDTNLPDICVNKVQLEQVILNLLSNSIDAINSKSEAESLIMIRTKRYDNEKICISIVDNGIGISPEQKKKLFAPFHTSKAHGMGIGLSLCYNIVEKHLGQIYAVSKLGKGTIFNVILPIVDEVRNIE